jgi:hypothetical protein
MLSLRSKFCFIVLTALMFAGFSNFMTQDAYAFDAADSTVTRTSATTIVVDSTDTNCAIPAGLFPADWVLSVPSITVTDVVITNAGTCIITLTTADNGDTSSTPTLTYNEEAGSNLATTEEANVADDVGMGAAVDNASPTVVSAVTASSTTITLTFTEDITDNSEIDDFTINGVAGGSTVSETSVASSVLTLTTAGFNMVFSDIVTVTFDGEAADLEDGSAATNDVADFSAFSVTNNEADSSGGSSGGKDKTKPTFGVDHKTSFQLIEDGFSFNDVAVDISDNHWTPYEQQSR